MKLKISFFTYANAFNFDFIFKKPIKTSKYDEQNVNFCFFIWFPIVKVKNKTLTFIITPDAFNL